MTEPDRLESHAPLSTHVADGLELFARQFADASRLQALLRALLASVQVAEDDAWELYGLAISTSSTHALDQIGSVLSQARPSGLGDAAYRTLLFATVRAHRSKTSPADLVAIAREAIGSYAFALSEPGPANVLLEPAATPSLPAAVLAGVLRRGTAAGVGVQVVDVPATTLFTFSADAELASSSATLGFSDTAGATGGALVGVVVA